MRKFTILGAILVALPLLVSSCTRPTVTIDINVSEAELAPFRKSGTRSVVGQGFLRQKGGGVVTCAGSRVLLAPDLPPIRQAINAMRSGKNVAGSGAQWHNAGRQAICDAQGNFRFSNLPPAEWFVFTEVRWQVGNWHQGGTLGAPVHTRRGGETQVYLTDDHYIGW